MPTKTAKPAKRKLEPWVTLNGFNIFRLRGDARGEYLIRYLVSTGDVENKWFPDFEAARDWAFDPRKVNSKGGRDIQPISLY